jgi:hypothetical protein
MTTTEATAAPAAPTALSADRTLSVLALIAGIVSVIFGQTLFVPIAAMVLGYLGYRREPTGRAFAVWGIVLGAVMLFGWVLLAILGALFFIPLIPFAFL